MSLPTLPTLPILDVVDVIAERLQLHHVCMVEAPPGAGKTTLLPLVLMSAAWMQGGKMLMLEPRRLAAKAAARRMAALLGERVGETVGYRMRNETAVSARTRIEVVTEGTLQRLLHDDPSLQGVSLVIFDEFHERSLQADVGLALTLMVRSVMRPDLKVLVMSATLQHLEGLPEVLGTTEADIVRSLGRAHSVDVHYATTSVRREDLFPTVRTTISKALQHDDGDVLVFLPGRQEIRRVREGLVVPQGVEIHELHGLQTAEEQDLAVRPAQAGIRRVILSTSIAETSLTIDGVRSVIDSGLSREPRFDLRSGMTRLVTVSVSHDAATQRAGRAGRTADGVCYRLWTRPEHDLLPTRRMPEIISAALASLVLECASWGIRSMNELRWVDEPPRAHVDQARELLRDLDAITDDNTITDHGKVLAAMGLHPRMAHMLTTAGTMGITATAVDLVALLGEKDILRTSADADLLRRLAVLRGMADADASRHDVRAAQLRAQHLHVRMRTRQHGPAMNDAADVARCIALAYPDRIAQRSREGSALYQLRHGRTARLFGDDALQRSPWLAIADVDGTSNDLVIRAAVAVSAAEVESIFADHLTTKISCTFDEGREAVVARRVRMLDALTISEQPLRDAPQHDIAMELARVLAQRSLRDLPWTSHCTQFIERVTCCRSIGQLTDLPAMDMSSLIARVDEWLVPHLMGMHRLRDVRSLDLAAILHGLLTWEQRQQLDRALPTTYRLPRGRNVAIDYTDPSKPVVAARLQDLFGVDGIPSVLNGRLPLTIHLLSPAGRPLQVTQDLAGFWRGSYADVRKEMRGRYPKHKWPERPWEEYHEGT
ncbi:MAG: ATP-dependent helicase HrpB [Bacteroidetes bacterium]|nr:ATP-dependent helicase HrpB [Bacteroidota bacterium]